MGRILTVEQAAEKLQVRPNTVREWLKKGRIPGRKFGRFYRISEDELERLAAGKEAKSAAEMSEEERVAHVKALRGKYAWAPGSVEEFIRRKQLEIDLEERRWRESKA